MLLTCVPAGEGGALGIPPWKCPAFAYEWTLFGAPPLPTYDQTETYPLFSPGVHLDQGWKLDGCCNTIS